MHASVGPRLADAGGATKVHPLWYTPILPLLFLTSAVVVGYPMVVFETTLATASLKRDGEMRVLAPLTRITIFLLGLYMALKIGDMVVRGTCVHLLEGSAQTRIDCLVCHDTTGIYEKTPSAAGMPDPAVDLVKVAQNVGQSSRKTCGECHFNGGGPEAVKHAHLLVPHLFPRDKEDQTAFWKHFDWQKAISEGMRVAGLPYSGDGCKKT